ncbi:MAG: hypothetical protein QUS33_04725 [Dehalococcoidia bacterium]|nr:hypothetical protein [Dehalococcoidia bacterium]
MQREVEAQKLVDYVAQIGPQVPVRTPPERHVGAIIADAVLQVGHRWKTHVCPRVQRLKRLYPEADTVPGLSRLIETRGTGELLNWKGKAEQQVFSMTVAFFHNEGIKTFDDLRKWLKSYINRDRLMTKSARKDKAGIPRIADRTADYYRVLVGIPDAVKVDSRVKQFLSDAGIEVKKYDYEDLRAIVQMAAAELGKRPLDLDWAIWNYQEARTKRVNSFERSRGEGQMQHEYFTPKQACEFSQQHGFTDAVTAIQAMQEPKDWVQARENGVKGAKWWLTRARIGANILLWEHAGIVSEYPLGRHPGGDWLAERRSKFYDFLETPTGRQWLANHNPPWLQRPRRQPNQDAATPDKGLLVDLTSAEIARLEKIAREFRIAPAALARMWILERIRQIGG